MLDRKTEYTQMAAVEGNLWWYKCLHALVLRMIENNLKKNINVIDAGCGTGGLMRYLKSNGYDNVKGIDISEYAVEICRSRSLDVIIDDLINISNHFRAGTADVIVSNDTLYFFSREEQIRIAKQFHKLLKVNGIAIINVPAFGAFRGVHDISVGIKYRFTKKDIWAVFEKTQFECLNVIYWPFLLTPFIYIARLFQRIKLKNIYNVKVKSDSKIPFGFINYLLFWLISFENNYFKKKPFGSSLFFVLKKK
ncbi:MAG: class I SAM-dependent methyltransferase [Cytophagales bacterium]|nr:class I SAM-dependent methyltransferase [Cytophagales bacterium]